jgi:hypothetical protein
MRLGFPRQILEKNTQISSFTKIRPVGAELFHAGRRPDGQHKANIRFSKSRESA